MPRSFPSFIDVHALLVEYLSEALGTPVSSKIPGDLSGEAVVVLDVSGSDDFVTDTALYDVQTFAPTRFRSRQLAESVRTEMLAAAGAVTPRGFIDFVSTASRPTRVSYENPDTTRYVATYRVPARALDVLRS